MVKKVVMLYTKNKVDMETLKSFSDESFTMLAYGYYEERDRFVYGTVEIPQCDVVKNDDGTISGPHNVFMYSLSQMNVNQVLLNLVDTFGKHVREESDIMAEGMGSENAREYMEMMQWWYRRGKDYASCSKMYSV